MQYISPASLFDDAKQFTFDKKAIQLGRKKLLAELELSGADSIHIKGISFAKNDIIDYFDDLLEGHSAEYHHAIEEDNVLKTFLEGYVIEQWSAFKENALYDDSSFILWISPWFYSAFTAYTDDCFEHRDDEGLRTILVNKLLMTGPDTERAWTIIDRKLTDPISLLNDYHRQDKRASEKISMQSISYFMEFLYIRMIQLLPESRFGGIRNKYAFAMMQACIYTFNRNVDNRYQAKTWMDNAILLAVSEELKTELSDKLEEMNNISASPGKKNPGLSSGGSLFLRLSQSSGWRQPAIHQIRNLPINLNIRLHFHLVPATHSGILNLSRKLIRCLGRIPIPNPFTSQSHAATRVTITMTMPMSLRINPSAPSPSSSLRCPCRSAGHPFYK